MEKVRMATKWVKPNRQKVQDSLSQKPKFKDVLTERKRQKVLSKIVYESNKEYDIKKKLGSKLSYIDENYESPQFIDRLAEFAIVNICNDNGEIVNTCVAYIHEVDGVYYAIDVKSGVSYYLSMDKCRRKFKEWVQKKCRHTWQEFFDENMIESEENVAYYDEPVREILLEMDNVDSDIAPNISVVDVTNDIMNYILVTDGLVHLNAYTEKSYYKRIGK